MFKRIVKVVLDGEEKTQIQPTQEKQLANNPWRKSHGQTLRKQHECNNTCFQKSLAQPLSI